MMSTELLETCRGL